MTYPLHLICLVLGLLVFVSAVPTELAGGLAEPGDPNITFLADNAMYAISNETVPEGIIDLSDLSDLSDDSVNGQKPGYYCDTTAASPWVTDIEKAADILQKRVKNGKALVCMVTNSVGSHCTRMVNSGTASIACCGETYRSMDCQVVVDHVKNGLALCKNSKTGKAGYHIVEKEDKYKLIVYHS